ncbi:MAG: hypothetical protein ACI4MH_01890 [Candidatus Coproplasma sp.]
MTFRQKILECISSNPGLSDRQLTDIIFGEDYPQQAVNSVCRKLATEGLIFRTERPIKNYLSDESFVNSATSSRIPEKNSTALSMKRKHIRKDNLISGLQRTLNSVSNSPIELKDDISLNELLSIKAVVTQINNFITYKLTIQFIEYLFVMDFITENQYCEMIEEIENTSSNANGFDIVSRDGVKIVAEVKGTVPYHDNRYGAAQVKSIIHDINNLCNGKAKSDIDVSDGFYRFMVVLDIKNSKEAMASLIKSKELNKVQGKLEIVTDGQYSNDKINIVFISLEDSN